MHVCLCMYVGLTFVPHMYGGTYVWRRNLHCLKAIMGGLWSSSPPILQTLCHWSIPMGLWWYCSNGTMFISLVGISFQTPLVALNQLTLVWVRLIQQLIHSSNFKIPLWNYNSITIIQQHLILLRYSCHHCQRIDFVELTQAPMASPGLEGPLTRANDPIERVYIPLRGGRTAWSPWTTVPQPMEITGQSAVALWQIVGSV